LLPEGEIKVQAAGTIIGSEIVMDKKKYKTGRNGQGEFPALPAMRRPVKNARDPTLESLNCKRKLRFPWRNRDTRGMAGCCFEAGHEAMVATDGYRLARAENGPNNRGLNGEVKVLVPKESHG